MLVKKVENVEGWIRRKPLFSQDMVTRIDKESDMLEKKAAFVQAQLNDSSPIEVFDLIGSGVASVIAMIDQMTLFE